MAFGRLRRGLALVNRQEADLQISEAFILGEKKSLIGLVAARSAEDRRITERLPSEAAL